MYCNINMSAGDVATFSSRDLQPLQRVKGAHMVFTTALAISTDEKTMLTVSADASALATQVSIRKAGTVSLPVSVLIAVIVAVIALLWFIVGSRLFPGHTYNQPNIVQSDELWCFLTEEAPSNFAPRQDTVGDCTAARRLTCMDTGLLVSFLRVTVVIVVTHMYRCVSSCSFGCVAFWPYMYSNHCYTKWQELKYMSNLESQHVMCVESSCRSSLSKCCWWHWKLYILALQ